MYELDLLFESAGFIIFVIIQIVIWIVFFFLAYNVGKIKNNITGRDVNSILDKAKRYDFAGNKQKAIEHYLEYIYVVGNTDWADEHKQNLMNKIKERVKTLGGSVPENFSIF